MFVENEYNNKNETLVNNHNILFKLQNLGYELSPIHDKNTNKFSENLIGIGENILCYLLPLNEEPILISDRVLELADFIIASAKIPGEYNISYYIIPCDLIKDNMTENYLIDYKSYYDKWELLEE